jgi:RNA polymerase sigma-70 factor (ECF subfamily)
MSPTPPVSAPDQLFTELRALGRAHLRYELVGKVDLSGVVQETLLDAHKAGAAFPAADPTQRTAWLTRVFRRNLTDIVRKATAARRDSTREVSFDGPAAASLPADSSSPSAPAHRAEDAARLGEALAALPPDQARAVELRHLDGRPVEEIAGLMGRTPAAVAGLLKRGLRALRDRLAGPGPGD